MANTAELIKSKIDIVDFIGSYISLKKAGRNFKAVCPFHKEKTPSFVISPDRQIWHCFGGCSDGGDAIKFLMKWENITFGEAVRELARKLGIKINNNDFSDNEYKLKERLYRANDLSREYFSYILQKTKIGDKGRQYLADRNVDLRLAQKFELGYAPDSWDSLYKFLVRKGFTVSEIVSSGLVVKNDKGRIYDRFRGRLVFPIKDSRGNTLGFSGRSLNPQEKSAKYINTPETTIYHKRESLYGIHIAKDAVRKNNAAILVEGEFDMITPFSRGIENIVATKGTAVTAEQLQLLKRFTNRLLLALDADSAGEEAIRRTISEAEPLDFEVFVVAVDYAKDPDEAVRLDQARFKKMIEKPLPVYDYIIDYFRKKHPGDDQYSAKNIADGVVPYLSMIRNPVVRTFAVKKLAGVIGSREEDITILISRYWRKRHDRVFVPHINTAAKDVSRRDTVEKFLLSLIFQSDTPLILAAKIFKELQPSDFSLPAYAKIIEHFFHYNTKFGEFDSNKFIQYLPEELRPVFDALFLFATANEEITEHDYRRLASQVKAFSLKDTLARLSVKTELSPEEENLLREAGTKLRQVEKSGLTV